MAGPTHGKNPPADVLDFGVLAKQEWRSWAEIQEQAHWADESGWDSFWVYDHLFTLRDADNGPNLEGWSLLAALAATTQHVQLGTLVTGITYRNPSMLFKQVTTVDHIAGGRAILGIGAGWNELEHRTYGIPFPPPGERVDHFGEAMAMFRMFETQERSIFHGQHYTLDHAPFEPKPVAGHIPVLIGSTGTRMMRHVARFADQWDGGGTVEEYVERGRRLAAVCHEVGRDPSEIRWVISATPDVVGSKDGFRDYVARYAEIGVRSFLFNIPRGTPTATMRAIADTVIPELRESLPKP